MFYSSVSNPKIKEIRKLKEKKYRDKSDLFLIEGEHLVIEAIKQKRLKEIFVLENNRFDFDIPTNYVTSQVMKTLSDLPSLPRIIGICEKKEGKLSGNVLMLDDVQDPGNLGTIIRSCVAFNIDTIILSEKSVDVYSPKVLRATQGMFFNIEIIKSDLNIKIDEMKEMNYKIYGTKVNGGKVLKTLEKSEKFAIIMGNEGNGVSKGILDKCDDYIYIKVNDNCESLNVAIATSIILYEFGR